MLAKEAEESQARLRRLREKDAHLKRPEQALYSARARRNDRSEPVVKRRRIEGEQSSRGQSRKDENVEGTIDGDSRAHRHADDHKTTVRESVREHGNRRRDKRSISPEHRSEHRRERIRSRSAERIRAFSQSNKQRDHNDRRRPSSDSSNRTRWNQKHLRSDRDTYGPDSGKRTKRSSSSDSNPLDEIIGPAPVQEPTVRSRGRGAFASKSSMDQRFSSDYNPSADLEGLEADEDDDWDQALEALRDRQKWKTKGAERLKAAGFTDDEVKKWEKGGTKDDADVRWSKRGEGRAWDVGKVMDEDGHVDVKARWGRLTPT